MGFSYRAKTQALREQWLNPLLEGEGKRGHAAAYLTPHARS